MATETISTILEQQSQFPLLTNHPSKELSSGSSGGKSTPSNPPPQPAAAATSSKTDAAAVSSSSAPIGNTQPNQEAPLMEIAMHAAWALYSFRNQEQSANAPALAEPSSQAVRRQDLLDQTIRDGSEFAPDNDSAFGVSLFEQSSKEEEHPESASTQANYDDGEADAVDDKTDYTLNESNEGQPEKEEEQEQEHPEAESDLAFYDEIDVGTDNDKTYQPLVVDQFDYTVSDSKESQPIVVDQTPKEVESLADEQRSIAHSLDDSQDSFWRHREQLFNFDDDDNDNCLLVFEENFEADTEKEQVQRHQERTNQGLSSDIQEKRLSVSTSPGSETGGTQTEHEPSPKKKSRVSFQEGAQESSFANVQSEGDELNKEDHKSKKRKAKDKKKKEKRRKKDKKKSESQTVEAPPPGKASSESSNAQLWKARDVDLQKVRENLAQARPKIPPTTTKPVRVQPSGLISSTRQGQKRLSSRVSGIPNISRTGSTQLQLKPTASGDGLQSERQNLNPTRASMLPRGVVERAPSRTAPLPPLPHQTFQEAWNIECMRRVQPDQRAVNVQRPTKSFGATTNGQIPVQQSLGRQNPGHSQTGLHGKQILSPTRPVRSENTAGAYPAGPRVQQVLPQTSGRGDLRRYYSNEQTRFTEETPTHSLGHQTQAAQIVRSFSGSQAGRHSQEIGQPSRTYQHPQGSWPNAPSGQPNTNQQNPMHGDFPHSQEAAEPLKVFCAERFVEAWPVVVAELSTGDWQRKDGNNAEASRPIELVESPIVDQCSVDIELGSQAAIVLCPLSSLSHETTGKANLLPIVSLCALGRYRDLFVILVLDQSPPAAHVTSAELQLHSATIRQIANLPTATHIKSAKEANLSESIAEIIFASEAAPCAENYVRHEPRNDFVSQRAQFLLELVPTMTSRGAIQSLNIADELGGFADLFTSERIRQHVSLRGTSNPSQAPDIPPTSMVQLSQGSRANMGRPASSWA